MRKLAASVGAVALTIAALVGAAGNASADTTTGPDNHSSTSDNHSTGDNHGTCGAQHSLDLNVLGCTDVGPVSVF